MDIKKCFNASEMVHKFSNSEPLKFKAICENIDSPNKSYNHYHQQLTKLVWQSNLHQIEKLLRVYRIEQHCNLACRDILGLSSVAETLLSLSDLASSILDVAYNYLYIEMVGIYGVPRDKDNNKQHLIILGMGKLGGGELNFSSDIDLILAYPKKGQTDNQTKQIDNELFFHKLAQKLVRLLDKYDENGFVYRVDMRLKPFGSVGSLAITFDSMCDYYLEHGRNWERYALVKMQAVAGDKKSGKELISRLESFIYQRHIDYSTMNSIEELKQKIILKSSDNNLKLGHGGIREIEFIVQTFQLMYGGRILDLRKQSLVNALSTLVENKLITEKVGKALNKSYQELRKIENAIQYYQDQQTHNIPNEIRAKESLLVALNISSWDILQDKIDIIKTEVSQIFNRIFILDGSQKAEDNKQKYTQKYWRKLISKTNIESKDRILISKMFLDFYKRMSKHKQGDKYLIRLNWILPQVIKSINNIDEPLKASQHILNLLEIIADKTIYLGLLVENPQILKKIIYLFMQSSWLARFLCSHPLVLDELIHQNHENVMQDKSKIKQDLDFAIEQNISNESKIQKIIDYKNAQVFRIASADLQDRINLMKVSDQLTWVCEVVLQEVLQIAQKELEEKYGKPTYELDDSEQKRTTKIAQFGIIAYGKLGGCEMGYGSDLDIVFLHNSKGINQQTNGNRSIPNQIFFTYLVAKVTKYMTATSINGKLYEVDTRLRPSGNAGMVVSSISAYRKYLKEEAWTWEHQALVRSRFITGGDRIAKEFKKIRCQIICQERSKKDLYNDVINMRQKMLENSSKPELGKVNIKHTRGGVTDIEFLVQYLLLKLSYKHKHLIRCSDNMRQIAALELFEVIRSSQASDLRNSYRKYRLIIHRKQLDGKKAIINEEIVKKRLELVKSIWDEVFDKV